MEATFKYRLLISYQGTAYAGWQIQPNDLTIQEAIEKALFTFLKEKVQIFGAGRTDAGVHAFGQVAHFTISREIDIRRLFQALNGILPHDIRIIEVSPVAANFHAQKSALSKIYHYHLWLEKPVSPFQRFYCHAPYEKINVELLKEAAKLFIGVHDFTTFANSANEGSAAKNALRTIYRLDVIAQTGGVRLEFEGNGFLYKMVRNIVGTLLEVSSFKRPLSDIEKLFNAQDRRAAGKAAPAQGLFLVSVGYPPSVLIPSNVEKCETAFPSCCLNSSTSF